jgi:hypothetical protein
MPWLKCLPQACASDEQTLGTGGWFLLLRPAVNRRFHESTRRLGGSFEVSRCQEPSKVAGSVRDNERFRVPTNLQGGEDGAPMP